ncbi:AI-2E family transporter, partial [Sulfurovum sp.]|uniref:AI-2E family transporter n=1 Tax=Sulfurovum sp. TaxID=1969726 RepID=UPI00261449DC
MDKQRREGIWPINQIFLLTATMLISIFLLKAASEIIVPFLIAVAIVIVLAPLFTRLESRHIPKPVSLVAVILLTLIPIVLLGGYVVDEAKSFAANYPTIKANFMGSLQAFFAQLGHYGIHIDETRVNAVLEGSNISDILKNLATQAKEQFSNLFLIFFMVAFMLMESTYFYDKMMKIAKDYRVDSTVWIALLLSDYKKEEK